MTCFGNPVSQRQNGEFLVSRVMLEYCNSSSDFLFFLFWVCYKSWADLPWIAEMLSNH